MTQKHIYVILGVGRSGTSAIARGMQAIGVDLGSHLMQANHRNPKGYWEDRDVMYKINRGFTEAIDYQWVTSPHFSHLPHPIVNHYQKAAISLLRQRFHHRQHWGFKDPRTSTILPFWQSVFKMQNLKEHYVIAIRHPLASSYSLQSFCEGDPDNDIERRLLFWVRHVITTIDETRDKNRVIVSYEEMLKSPESQLRRIHQSLGLTHALNEKEMAVYANEFLDKKLSHHHYSMDEMLMHPAVAAVPLCIPVYQLLTQVARDEISMSSPEFETAWQEIKTEFNHVLPLHHYIETLLYRNKQQQRALRTIRKSIPWKMISPARWIDDKFREWRKTSEKRRKQEVLFSEG